jgi:hypothetical protein
MLDPLDEHFSYLTDQVKLERYRAPAEAVRGKLAAGNRE